MIISLKLKNFRRHEDLSVDFTEGLNAIRGANEGGKSTIVEAMLYALYGAKALRDTLAETVTWGMKESVLGVTLTLQARGAMFVFTRSKNGAECNGDDGTKVTGQGEVTAFAAELLGADAKTAAVLMLASQSGLRGALDDGPAAVSGLMAKLADFDIVDRILAQADKVLLTGSVQPLMAKVTETEEALVAAKLSIPDEEQIVTHEAESARLATEIEVLTKNRDEVLQASMDDAMEALGKAEDANDLNVRAVSALTDLQNRIAVEDVKRKAALDDTLKAPGAAVLAQLREDARLEGEYTTELKKYQTFQRLKYPEMCWEGTEEAFLAQLALDQQGLDTEKQGLARLEGQITAIRARVMRDGKCSACGHSAKDPAHVAAHNGALAAEMTPLEAAIQVCRGALAEAATTVKDMEAVRTSAGAFLRSLAPCGDRLSQNPSFYPPKVVWKGSVPGATPSTSAATLLLREKEAIQRTADQAQGRFDAAMSLIRSLEVETVRATERIAQCPRFDLEPLKAKHDEAYKLYMAASVKRTELVETQRLVDLQVGRLCIARDQAKLEIRTLTDKIAGLRSLITETEFNNGLVAKLKKVKPAITDHLWGTVLAAVGTFFSAMRGEQSLVTKDKDGFKVNGKSVDSLSGSTLDVLALAIRVALTKTFIPHASFLCLDEPAYGCDADRTGNVLGFLAGTGFLQTILASHDDMSESVADNVIGL